MKWMKRADMYEASGANGVFRIVRHGTFYYPEYMSHDQKKFFKMPRKKYIADAKTMCENNRYWEEE